MRKNILVWAIAACLSLCLGVPCGKAQELYRAYVSQVCISTNATGGLVYKPFGNRDFIRKCARDQGMTNLAGLSLVFNRTANALQVVSGTNHVLVCTPLSFSGGVSLTNTNNTKVERLEFVYADAATMANGTLIATERSFLRSSNQLTGFALTGRLQYAVPAAGTNSPTIYSGSIVAGQVFAFHHDSEEDDDQARISGFGFPTRD
ncbi:MAG TPA: hypothetical protein VNU68_26360 [Verrucomicrobiae bacterium]|jgi:hypothetical protein|nr:hypothetical protein [Verrucomicrobiae bacterium]